MSVVVTYPVEIRKYQVSIGRSRAEIQLEGVEGPEAGADREVRRVGNITFGKFSTFSGTEPIGDEDFITRGGFLKMDRPLEMFAGILDLLRHEKPVFLNDDGTLTTSLEPAGEEER